MLETFPMSTVMAKDSLAQIAPADTAIGPPSATARRLVDASVSDNTRRAYAGALRRLDTWLAARPLDDAALAAYLSRHALREAAGQAAGRLIALALFAGATRCDAGWRPGPTVRRCARSRRRHG